MFSYLFFFQYLNFINLLILTVTSSSLSEKRTRLKGYHSQIMILPHYAGKMPQNLRDLFAVIYLLCKVSNQFEFLENGNQIFLKISSVEDSLGTFPLIMLLNVSMKSLWGTKKCNQILEYHNWIYKRTQDSCLEKSGKR